MAEKKDLSLSELKKAYEVNRIFLDEYGYIIRNDEKPTPGDRAKFNFHNQLQRKIKNKIEEKLNDINELI